VVVRGEQLLAVTPTGTVVATLATGVTSEPRVHGALVSFRRGRVLHMINLLEPAVVDTAVLVDLPPKVDWELVPGEPPLPNTAPMDRYWAPVILRYGAAPTLELIADLDHLDGPDPTGQLRALRDARPTLTAEGRELLRRYPTLRDPTPAAPPFVQLSASTPATALPRSAGRLACGDACRRTYQLPAGWPYQLVVVGTAPDRAQGGVHPLCVWRDPTSGRFASLARPAVLLDDAEPLPCEVRFAAAGAAYGFAGVPARPALRRQLCTGSGCREVGELLAWLGPELALEPVPGQGSGDCPDGR
jgi:hypothetical protein